MVFVPGKVQQQVGHLVPHHRVQPVGGFVQQQQLGMVRQRHRDAQFHLHAGGVILILLFIRQTEFLAQLRIGGSVPITVDARHHLARLYRVQAQGDALAAQHHADLLLGANGNSAAVPAKNGHGAAVPLHHV